MHTYGGTYFRLNTDIHVTADEWVPIGLGENWAPFHGNFDGGEHTISGVIKSNKYAYFGFFGYIYYSRISSLKIAATVKSEYSGTSDYEPTTGGIAGYCEGAIISNSHVTGNVTGGNTKENEFVQPSETGGIVGFNWGNITDCTVSSTITGGRSNRSSTGGITGTNYGHIANCTVAASGRVIGSGNSSEYVGGIVGIIFGSSILVSEISNCTNHATIISTGIGSYAGGLVGSNNPQGATIHTSLNTGNISGSGYVGGLVGGNVSYFSGSTYYGYVYSCCTNTGLVNGQPATNANQIGYGGGVEPCPDGHTKR
ncbi:hypothetical protein FACS1894181_14380 [Bacteroidia bacterium]|nr:hypothetical protein FACS1894181_14380 [Bacteroidia bacterium]